MGETVVLRGVEHQRLVVLNRVLMGDLTAAEAATVRERSVRQVRRMLAAVLGAEILVSDDADPFKTAADATGLLQQVCTAHVGRNTAAWVEAISPALATDADGSLATIGVAPEQAVADGQALLRLMRERQPTLEASAQLAMIHHRYLGATKPAKGETMSLAYRLR